MTRAGGLGNSFGGGLGGHIEGCLAAALGDGGGVGVARSLKHNLVAVWSVAWEALGSLKCSQGAGTFTIHDADT